MKEAGQVERPFRVVVGRLVQKRSGARRANSDRESRRPARVALALALAHSIQTAIDSAEIRDQAEAARRFGITRARVTQVLDLIRLSPSLQQKIIAMRDAGTESLTEHALRDILRYDSWAFQEALWVKLTGLPEA